MAEVTVLGNGVVELGYNESQIKQAIRQMEEEQKQMLQDYINGKYGTKSTPSLERR